MKAPDHLGLFFLFALICVANCTHCSAPVEAQASVRLGVIDARLASSREPAVVTLARFLCGESDAKKQSVAALLWTMQRRATAHGLSLVSMVRSYSAPLLGRGGRRGAWVRLLPAVLPTRRYRGNWLTGVDGATAFLAGKLPDPCERPTYHFGSAADMRARFPNAIPIDCGDTSDGNIYISEDGS